MTFKEKIVRLRKNRGLTQDEFASAVGVSRQAVYKWESGQSYPEVAKLLEIKALFEISIDNLLDDTFEVEAPEKKKKKRAEAPVAEKKAEPVEEPKAEEPKVEEPKAEETVAEEPLEAVEEATEKSEKRGFFARIFARK